MELLALTASAARRFGEIGFLIGALGAFLLAAGAARADVQWRNLAMLVGPLLIGVGFVLGIVYVHWI